MNDFWGNIKKRIKILSDKTEEMTKVGRIKLEILAVKRDIEKNMVELGGRIYHQINVENKYSFKKDKQVEHLVQKIKTFETKLESLEAELKRIREEGVVNLD